MYVMWIPTIVPGIYPNGFSIENISFQKLVFLFCSHCFVVYHNFQNSNFPHSHICALSILTEFWNCIDVYTALKWQCFIRCPCQDIANYSSFMLYSSHKFTAWKQEMLGHKCFGSWKYFSDEVAYTRYIQRPTYVSTLQACTRGKIFRVCRQNKTTNGHYSLPINTYFNKAIDLWCF